jgi:hypothetical protein
MIRCCARAETIVCLPAPGLGSISWVAVRLALAALRQRKLRHQRVARLTNRFAPPRPASHSLNIRISLKQWTGAHVRDVPTRRDCYHASAPTPATITRCIGAMTHSQDRSKAHDASGSLCGRQARHGRLHRKQQCSTVQGIRASGSDYRWPCLLRSVQKYGCHRQGRWPSQDQPYPNEIALDGDVLLCRVLHRRA